MKNKIRRHWTNWERAPTGAWERALRPNGSSRWLFALLLLATVVFLTLAVWTGLQDARQQEQQKQQSQSQSQQKPSLSPVPYASAPGGETASRMQQIFKCTTRAGSSSYSDAPCPAGTFSSTVTVQPNMNIVDGMTPEDRAASVDRNAAVAQRMAQREQIVASSRQESSSMSAMECGRLKTSIATLDAMARQPLSSQAQDRLRIERMQLRDQYFALRCQ